MSFDKLMAELGEVTAAQETLSKALPAEDGKDDQTIQAAAGEGGSDEGEGGTTAVAEDDKDEDGKPMAKSFMVKLADGTEVEAEDGTELIKSLTERLDASEGTLTKAIEGCVSLIKSQQDLIKSMSDRITKIASTGTGRKAVVSVTDKPDNTGTTLAKSEPKGLTGQEFMAKAMDAFNGGKISGLDVSLAETCLNRGEAIPASLIQRVLQ